MTDILKVKVNGEWVSIPAIKGENGEGVPTGGTTGQVLTKKTDTDYDTEWQTLDATDVQINGTSIVSSNIANIVTNTAYNASSNKIATMSDVPSITNLANKDLSNLSSTGEARFNGKADVDLSNVNNTGKIAIAHNAMPSDTYETLTILSSGSDYTAPADGWFSAIPNGGALGTGQWISLYYPNALFGSSLNYAGGGSVSSFINLEAKKGQKVVFLYGNIASSNLDLVFYYAQGSESEA